MLIVGGTAAVTAIVIYLAWHYFSRWRAAMRLRRAEQRARLSRASPDAAGARTTRELVS